MRASEYTLVIYSDGRKWHLNTPPRVTNKLSSVLLTPPPSQPLLMVESVWDRVWLLFIKDLTMKLITHFTSRCIFIESIVRSCVTRCQDTFGSCRMYVCAHSHDFVTFGWWKSVRTVSTRDRARSMPLPPKASSYSYFCVEDSLRRSDHESHREMIWSGRCFRIYRSCR